MGDSQPNAIIRDLTPSSCSWLRLNPNDPRHPGSCASNTAPSASASPPTVRLSMCSTELRSTMRRSRPSPLWLGLSCSLPPASASQVPSSSESEYLRSRRPATDCACCSSSTEAQASKSCCPATSCSIRCASSGHWSRGRVKALPRLSRVRWRTRSPTR